MPTTKPDLVCPVDGISTITITPITVGANDVPQSVQWQCTRDPTHTGIIQAGGSANKSTPGGGPVTGAITDYLADSLVNFFSNPPNPTTSKNFEIDDGGIYIQRLVAPKVATIAQRSTGPPSQRGFDTTVPVANGMNQALQLLNTLDGKNPILPGTAGPLFFDLAGDLIVDFYQAYTSTINNYDFYEPAALKDILLQGNLVSAITGGRPGGKPTSQIVADLHAGIRGPFLDPDGVFDSPVSQGIGMPTSTPLIFPITPPYGGLRLAAHYTPKGNDPPHQFSHWIQVIGCTDRATLVLTNSDAFVTQNADSNGLFWAMDTGSNGLGDSLDPFYDTPHPLSSPPQYQTHTTATPQWFIDIPTTSVRLPYSTKIYGLFLGYWIDANGNPVAKRQPAATTNIFSAATLISNWQGVNWYALNSGTGNASPANQAALWSAAVANDALYPNNPGPFTDGNHHYRNDWVLVNAGVGNGFLYITLADFNSGAGHAAIIAIFAENGLGPGGTFFPNPIPHTVVKNPLIAISTQGYVYEYLHFYSLSGHPEIRIILRVPALNRIAGGQGATVAPVPIMIDVWTPVPP